MRVLVYGFGPYRQFQENVTEKILRQLPKRRLLKRVVFPVRFHKSQFTNTIKAFNPDVILGLGQCSNGGHLRIETRAVNKRRNEKTERTQSIVAGGAKRRDD
jgi:pyrrolidone-carboxylate peptidase